MQRIFLGLWLATCLHVTALAATPGERYTASAPAEAIHLVLLSQSEELLRLDPESEDTALRQWSVQRPAPGDTPDKAATFIVSLSIDGRALGAWYVNTEEGTVEPHEAGSPEESVAATARIDADITYVATIGRWQTPDGQGSYRITTWNEGFEHVSTAVRADWIADATDANAPARTRSSSVLVMPGLYRLRAPKLTERQGELHVELQGVNTYDAKQTVSCQFDLFPDGQVTHVKPCGPADKRGHD
ncbi:hypothetical protein [Arenimonas oryziterrae]|nr:hypothetical protein [Arenimonas oryziterrae]